MKSISDRESLAEFVRQPNQSSVSAQRSADGSDDYNTQDSILMQQCRKRKQKLPVAER